VGFSRLVCNMAAALDDIVVMFVAHVGLNIFHQKYTSTKLLFNFQPFGNP